MPALQGHARRLLRVEASRAERALGLRRFAAAAHPGGVRGERGDLWQPAHPAGARRCRDEGESQARGAPDAPGGATGTGGPLYRTSPGHPRLLPRGAQLGDADVRYTTPTSSGWPTSLTSRSWNTGATSRWSWTATPGASSAGAWGPHKTTALTLRALSRAVANRKPRAGLVFHSDRGVEYAAYEFRTRLAALGIRQSMNRPGEPTDNAHMESFFHSLKTERLYGCNFATEPELRSALRTYIAFYNQRRLHSALDYRSPADYERAAA